MSQKYLHTITIAPADIRSPHVQAIFQAALGLSPELFQNPEFDDDPHFEDNLEEGVELKFAMPDVDGRTAHVLVRTTQEQMYRLFEALSFDRVTFDGVIEIGPGPTGSIALVAKSEGKGRFEVTLECGNSRFFGYSTLCEIGNRMASYAKGSDRPLPEILGDELLDRQMPALMESRW